MSFDAALHNLRPARIRWRAWGLREPALAQIDYCAFRRELRDASLHRADELLAALVRAGQDDPSAVEVLTACLWPGLRALVARHAPGLDHDDAMAVAVAGLVESVKRFPADPAAAPQFVAAWLLRLPKRRLRGVVRREREDQEHRCRDPLPDRAGSPGAELTATALLRAAVTAGVIRPADAWLLWAVDVVGHSLGFAARQLGIAYDAVRQRRHRAAQRWRAWWFAPDELGDRQEAVA